MICHFVWKSSPQIGFAQNLHEKLGELKDLAGKPLNPIKPGGIIPKNILVVLSNHCDTGSRWRHHDFGALEDCDKSLRKPPRRSPVTAIESRLTATCLVLWVFDLQSQAIQNRHNRFPYLGIELISQSRYKERHRFAR